jgi:hypothetical protein
MPCNQDEESMHAPDPDPPCTQPKPTSNGGACQIGSDGETESEDNDSDDLNILFFLATKIHFLATNSRPNFEEDHRNSAGIEIQAEVS